MSGSSLSKEILGQAQRLLYSYLTVPSSTPTLHLWLQYAKTDCESVWFLLWDKRTATTPYNVWPAFPCPNYSLKKGFRFLNHFIAFSNCSLIHEMHFCSSPLTSIPKIAIVFSRDFIPRTTSTSDFGHLKIYLTMNGSPFLLNVVWLTSLKTSLTALFASPALGCADTQTSMIESETEIMPSRCLLAPGFTWHCRWIRLDFADETRRIASGEVIEVEVAVLDTGDRKRC